MLNGKFIATRDVDQTFTKGKTYSFIDGYVVYDDGVRSVGHVSLKDFEVKTNMFNVLIEQPQPTRTVNVTKTNGDSVQMKFSYKDSEETVEYTVEGDGDLGDIMVMLREVTMFMTHLGFPEEVVLRKMKDFVEQSGI